MPTHKRRFMVKIPKAKLTPKIRALIQRELAKLATTKRKSVSAHAKSSVKIIQNLAPPPRIRKRTTRKPRAVPRTTAPPPTFYPVYPSSQTLSDIIGRRELEKNIAEIGRQNQEQKNRLLLEFSKHKDLERSIEKLGSETEATKRLLAAQFLEQQKLSHSSRLPSTQLAPTINKAESEIPREEIQKILAPERKLEEEPEELSIHLNLSSYEERTGKIARPTPPKVPVPKARIIFADGRGELSGKGISNYDIDKILNKYPQYVGCIAHDEIPTRIIPQVRPCSDFGFVINTDPHDKPGEHWQSVFVSNSPLSKGTVEFYDSYADHIDKQLFSDLANLVKHLQTDRYLKFKENRVRNQNCSSANCGYFAAKFLEDRFNGLPFPTASGFSGVKKSEDEIERYKKQHGGFVQYFPPTQEGGLGFYTDWPPGVRKYLTEDKIKSLKVGRLPVSSGMQRLLEFVTLGGWKSAIKKVGYDDVYHLYLVATLENGKQLRMERNHVFTVINYSQPKGEESRPVDLRGKNITMKEFLEKGLKSVGPSFFRYSAFSNNCQDAVLQLLGANGLLTPELKIFVKQDTQKLVEQLPWYTKWVSETVTDAGHLAERAIRGKGNAHELNI